jgi:phage I-like protein
MLLRSVRLHFSSGPQAELPARILVGKWGRNPSVKGDYLINEVTVRALPAALKQVNFDTVALDFEHNTVPGSPAYKAEQEPRRVAAHGTLSVVPGEGLYFQPATWTPEGKTAVHGGHFPDLSPAIITNDAGEVVFVHSVALCRQGATEGLALDLHSAGLATLSAQPSSPSAMDKYKALLLTLLALPETADDAAIETAAKGMASKVDGAAKAAEAATAQVKTMSADLASLKDLVTGGERQRLINEATAAGKLVLNSVAELPIDSLKKVLAELPAGVVPLERRTPEGIKTHSSDVVSGDSAVEAEVARQLGIKPAAKK